jgi:hypothetical protein
MPATLNRRVVLAARPQGAPTEDNFRLEDAPVPTPGAGELLLETLYLSLDPYMRGRMDDAKSYAPPVALGAVMEGATISKITQSNHPDYAPGDIVLARAGWQSHAISDGTGLRKLNPATAPLAAHLGILGMPGFTAYGGMRNIAKPQPGETLVVSAASGPVGATVGQLARIAGARAVGIAGGPDKCAYLLNELNFDAAIDHRSPNFAADLAAACPAGIDIYFENVGGPVLDTVLPLLNNFARIPVCGTIAYYNGTSSHSGPDRLPATMRKILVQSLTFRGFINGKFIAQFPDFEREMTARIANGTIKYREDLTQGLDAAPAAFIGMLQGRNFGKAIVQVGVP